jgi:hypothetical protein
MGESRALRGDATAEALTGVPVRLGASLAARDPARVVTILLVVY